jgi:NADH dehydrogenase/NADH:ubiquinone oxidoreductase subunit G
MERKYKNLSTQVNMNRIWKTSRIAKSWNAFAFCIFYWHSYEKQEHNIYKQFKVLSNTHDRSLQNYVLRVPLKLYTENSGNYLNLEGVYKLTKSATATTNRYFDLSKFYSSVLHNTNDVLHHSHTQLTFVYDVYITTTKVKQNWEHIQVPSYGVQYSNFTRKTFNHASIQYSLIQLNNTYHNTSYIMSTATQNSHNLLHMHRKYLKGAYSNLYYN